MSVSITFKYVARASREAQGSDVVDAQFGTYDLRYEAMCTCGSN